jgi:hypothetical protein
MIGSKTKDSTNRINFLFSIFGGFAPQTQYQKTTTFLNNPYLSSYMPLIKDMSIYYHNVTQKSIVMLHFFDMSNTKYVEKQGYFQWCSLTNKAKI